MTLKKTKYIGALLKLSFLSASFLCVSGLETATSQTISASKLESLKSELSAEIDKNQKLTQEMVDMVFSFGELGFQEFESSKYLTDILKKNGFTIEYGNSGIPTMWKATWGAGKPVIAVGSDLDCIPKASQKPGVAYHDPIVEGAPGHGEGHNSGEPLNVTAVLALKKIMEREKISGTLVVWPGIAEEQIGAKAHLVRDGFFKNIDACIFTHVGNNLNTFYGGGGRGLVSVRFNFQGESAHAASQPWRGKSALDAVELMNTAWNFHREHLETDQRSHYVIVDGGDQPNVVPSKAAVWYYFRETTFPKINSLYKDGVRMAEAAASMTDTKMTYQLLGSAWPMNMNKPLAETMFSNIKQVGLPKWTEADQTLAKALQKELGSKVDGLAIKLPDTLLVNGGASDDIADISWNLPTIVLSYPSNIPGAPGHNWANAVAMATPIAHKGVSAGAKAEAMTILDLLTKPELLKQAWTYFNDVQVKDIKYQSFLSATDKPPIELNKKIMDEFRPEMKKFYYDPSKYSTYLEQLGIKYPTVRTSSTGDK